MKIPASNIVELMAEKGRAPSFDSSGNIRGFRSRPGAPMSPQNSMGARGIPSSPGGGLSDANAWGRFFGGNSVEGVRLGYSPASPGIATAAKNRGIGLPYSISAGSPGVSQPFSVSPPPFPLMNTKSMFADTPSSDEYLGNVIGNAKQYLSRFT